MRRFGSTTKALADACLAALGQPVLPDEVIETRLELLRVKDKVARAAVEASCGALQPQPTLNWTLLRAAWQLSVQMTPTHSTRLAQRTVWQLSVHMAAY